MMKKAGDLGLAYRGEVVPTGYEIAAAIHDSFKSFLWGLYPIVKFGRRFHRRIAAPATRDDKGSWLSVNETIDGSVFDRWRELATYRSSDLARWAAELGIDPAKLHGTVDARTGVVVEPPVASKPRAKRPRTPAT